MTALLLAAVSGQVAAAEARVALVIGNSAYQHAPALANPTNDARAVVAALQRLDFQVEEALDLDIAGVRLALSRFADLLQDAEVGLFFYAGHGLQVRGQNYLVPVDARLGKETDLIFQAVDFANVLRLLEDRPRTSLVFLDACRDNPLARSLARNLGQARSQVVGQGLAQVESGIGTLIAYATQPGNIASDGAGAHSPFTDALLANLETPGLEVRQMLSRVRKTVIASTAYQQVPWDHSSLTGDFYFKPPEPAAAPPAPPPLDMAIWQAIEGSTQPEDFRTFIAQYPDSPLVPFARNRIVALRASETGETASRPLMPEPGAGNLPPTTEPEIALAPPPPDQPAAAAPDQQAATEPKPETPPPAAQVTAIPEPEPQPTPAQPVTAQPVPMPQPEAPFVEESPSEPPIETTVRVLRDAPQPEPPSEPPTVGAPESVELALGWSQDDWRAIQRALNALGHPAGPEDGVPGGKTRSALAAWQRASGNLPSGYLIADQRTRLLKQAEPQLAALVATKPRPSPTEAPIHECDRLAAHPDDPNRLGQGVDFEGLDAKPSIVACTDAMYPGEARFQFQLGRVLVKAERYADALVRLRKAAGQDYAAAESQLGLMYLEGRGVPQDHAQAVAWWRKAAEQGYGQAQNNLGVNYENGLGVPQDLPEAVAWYRKAAEQGDAAAQSNLGTMYARGRGVPQDDAQAVAWVRKAAEQGNALAQTNLGLMYEFGRGVRSSRAQAVVWYRKAADQGEENAIKALERLQPPTLWR